jgi:hypothetical protein
MVDELLWKDFENPPGGRPNQLPLLLSAKSISAFICAILISFRTAYRRQLL